MPRSLDYRSTLQHSADEVYATMVDPDYLRARLDRLGGPGAELLEHRADADGARYRLRHGLSSADLPPLITALMPGDLVIERTETLVRKDVGRYAGNVSVDIRGIPASAASRLSLADRASGGSELDVHADVTVNVFLIGGRIEAVIAEQVKKLLAAETAFILDWLGRDH